MDRYFRKPVGWAVLLACCWLGAASCVLAEPPAPDARALGITEGILNYCSKVDAEAAVKYQDKVKQLVQGASNEALVKARNSDEYRRARASVEDFVSKVDEHNAKRVCSNGIATPRTIAAHP